MSAAYQPFRDFWDNTLSQFPSCGLLLKEKSPGNISFFCIEKPEKTSARAIIFKTSKRIPE